MVWRRWFRPELEPNEGGLIGYRRELLVFLSALTFFASWLPLRPILAQRLPTPRELATAGFGFALGALAFLLHRHRPRLASWLLTLGSLPLTVLVFLILRQPSILSLLALPVFAAALLIGWPVALAVGIGALVAIVGLDTGPFLGLASAAHGLLVIAAAGIGLCTDRGLRLVDHWERESAVQQREMIFNLRERQGELNRTIKALNEAYAQLERSHDELAVARQQAEEARAIKEQFVANVSHELRTPLNLIVGFAELMYLVPESYQGVQWSPDLEGDVRELYRASRHLQSLVNDILDLSRIDAAKLPMFRELTNLRGIIDDAIETIAPLLRQRKLTLNLECPDALPQLFVDRTRIRQVLLNLFNNAARYTDRGGITVHIKLTEKTVAAAVRDTGLGIPADQLERIFEEFGQADGGRRSRGGAGLGLAISRRFVELHGGRMWAESEPGLGSTFHFSLPLPGAVPETTPLYHIPGPKTAERSGAVVIVDPDPSIADMLSRYLGDRRVVAATNTKEAEALIEREHPAAVVVNQPPDAPQEAWLEGTGELSGRYDVPIVRCSLPSASWLTQAQGLDGLLAKPVLSEALQRLLTAQGPPPDRVLVVDDDPGFVRLMVRLLGTLFPSIKVAKAISGAQALRLAREKTPDLVLLDLRMPLMDGFQVAQAMRADPALAKTRIIAVTATSYGEEALQRRGGHLTLTQAQGLSAGMVTELLNAIVGIVRPKYA